MANDDQSGTQKPAHKVANALDTAEFYLDEAARLAATGEPDATLAAERLFTAAAAAALVSLARNVDALNDRLSLCGHGYLGALCHLCMARR